MPYDLVVKGGTVISSSDTFVADVGVSDGRVVAVGRLGSSARHILDARGRLVLPGGLDALQDLSDAPRELRTGSTTLIETLPRARRGFTERALAARLRTLGKGCPADFAFVLGHHVHLDQDELARLVASGIPPLDEARLRDWQADITAHTHSGMRFTGLWDAVQKGRITENRFVELTAGVPARLFGLYPRKGHLDAGADADIVVIDPNKTHADDGRIVKGSVLDVFVRGTKLIEAGKPIARRMHGKFLRRVLEVRIPE